ECFFFFQAEDGIRDFHVTGVQTCALPIWALRWADGLILRVEPLNIEPHPRRVLLLAPPSRAQRITSRGDKLTWLNWNSSAVRDRSEERRVGKECRAGGGPYD